MAISDLVKWLDAWSKPDAIWYVKRLAANDTLANNAHQAGPYIPKRVILNVFPTLKSSGIQNPDQRVPLSIDSHEQKLIVRAIWYNNKHFGKTRDEARITNFGGKESPLLKPDNTGALVVFVFCRDAQRNAKEIRVWVCEHPYEEEVIEDRIGPIEPGRSVLWCVDRLTNPDIFTRIEPERTSCRLSAEEIPIAWRTGFPSGVDIIRKAIALRPSKGLDVDTRIVDRRLCEYEIFLSLEESIELPLIRKGFQSVDEFVARAQTILQRRKARSGNSLELQLREILCEEGFLEGVTFSHQPESDPGKRPDFLFPSESAYKNPAFAKKSLRMLAVKTTCKDRWRQILNEADRVKTKHLLTLQEGVSENQFKEMNEANVRLVVPKALHGSYPTSIRPSLLSLRTFLGEMKALTR